MLIEIKFLVLNVRKVLKYTLKEISDIVTHPIILNTIKLFPNKVTQPRVITLDNENINWVKFMSTHETQLSSDKTKLTLNKVRLPFFFCGVGDC